jgi:ATP/maltotriose-dependent transcriptional regulator MalT
MTVSRARPADVRRGMALIERAASLAGALGDPYLLGFARINLGTAWMTLGDWEESERALELGLRTLEEGRCVGVSWECSFARACMVNVLRCLGRMEELSALGNQWLRIAIENGDRYGGVWIRLHTAAGVLASGDPQAAQARLDESMAGWPGTLFTPQHMAAALLAAEIDLYRGDPARAVQRLDDCWATATRSFAMGWQVTRIWALQVRAGAAVALARAEPKHRDSSMATARRCLAGLLREGARPHAVGAALTVQAGLDAADGRTQAAALRLDRAASQFDAAKMGLHAASARWSRARLLGEDPEPFAQRSRALGVRDVDRWAAMYMPGTAA